MEENDARPVYEKSECLGRKMVEVELWKETVGRRLEFCCQLSTLELLGWLDERGLQPQSAGRSTDTWRSIRASAQFEIYWRGVLFRFSKEDFLKWRRRGWDKQ